MEQSYIHFRTLHKPFPLSTYGFVEDDVSSLEVYYAGSIPFTRETKRPSRYSGDIGADAHDRAHRTRNGFGVHEFRPEIGSGGRRFGRQGGRLQI